MTPAPQPETEQEILKLLRDFERGIRCHADVFDHLSRLLAPVTAADSQASENHDRQVVLSASTLQDLNWLIASRPESFAHACQQHPHLRSLLHQPPARPQPPRSTSSLTKHEHHSD